MEEPTSQACRQLLQDKVPMVVWALTRTELSSALWRRARAGHIATEDTPADALQLAAALVVFEERPKGREFITSDGALALCARAEGFNVVVPN